jgi:hypothetical protein
VVATFAGIVVMIFAADMLLGWIPINGLTISVVSLAAIVPVLNEGLWR